MSKKHKKLSEDFSGDEGIGQSPEKTEMASRIQALRKKIRKTWPDIIRSAEKHDISYKHRIDNRIESMKFLSWEVEEQVRVIRFAVLIDIGEKLSENLSSVSDCVSDIEKLREQFLEGLYGLKFSFLRKRPHYYSTILDRDQRIAAAEDGLLHAAERYDPERGTAFSTYAYKLMRTRIAKTAEPEVYYRNNTTSLDAERGKEKDTLHTKMIDQKTENVHDLSFFHELTSSIHEVFAILPPYLRAVGEVCFGLNGEHECNNNEKAARLMIKRGFTAPKGGPVQASNIVAWKRIFLRLLKYNLLAYGKKSREAI